MIASNFGTICISTNGVKFWCCYYGWSARWIMLPRKQSRGKDRPQKNILGETLADAKTKKALMPIYGEGPHVISFLIEHANIKHKLIKYDLGKDITSFHPSNMEIYYKLAKPKVSMMDECIPQFTRNKNYHEIMEG